MPQQDYIDVDPTQLINMLHGEFQQRFGRGFTTTGTSANNPLHRGAKLYAQDIGTTGAKASNSPEGPLNEEQIQWLTQNSGRYGLTAKRFNQAGGVITGPHVHLEPSANGSIDESILSQLSQASSSAPPDLSSAAGSGANTDFIDIDEKDLDKYIQSGQLQLDNYSPSRQQKRSRTQGSNHYTDYLNKKFELLKEAGRLDEARDVANKLKNRGWEVGEGGGFPYVKNPNAKAQGGIPGFTFGVSSNREKPNPFRNPNQELEDLDKAYHSEIKLPSQRPRPQQKQEEPGFVKSFLGSLGAPTSIGEIPSFLFSGATMMPSPDEALQATSVEDILSRTLPGKLISGQLEQARRGEEISRQKEFERAYAGPPTGERAQMEQDIELVRQGKMSRNEFQQMWPAERVAAATEPIEAQAYRLASGIPILGPQATTAYEQFKSGQTASGVGTVAGMTAAILGPHMLGKVRGPAPRVPLPESRMLPAIGETSPSSSGMAPRFMAPDRGPAIDLANTRYPYGNPSPTAEIAPQSPLLLPPAQGVEIPGARPTRFLGQFMGPAIDVQNLPIREETGARMTPRTVSPGVGDVRQVGQTPQTMQTTPRRQLPPIGGTTGASSGIAFIGDTALEGHSQVPSEPVNLATGIIDRRQLAPNEVFRNPFGTIDPNAPRDIPPNLAERLQPSPIDKGPLPRGLKDAFEMPRRAMTERGFDLVEPPERRVQNQGPPQGTPGRRSLDQILREGPVNERGEPVTGGIVDPDAINSEHLANTIEQRLKTENIPGYEGEAQLNTRPPDFNGRTEGKFQPKINKPNFLDWTPEDIKSNYPPEQWDRAFAEQRRMQREATGKGSTAENISATKPALELPEGKGGEGARPFDLETPSGSSGKESTFLGGRGLLTPFRELDRIVSPYLREIHNRVVEKLGHLPESITKYFQEDPLTKNVLVEGKRFTENFTRQSDAILNLLSRTDATREELTIADRVARGVPTDLTTQRLRPELMEVTERVRNLAQQLTAERQALGLPVREEWLKGPEYWYPNLWNQHMNVRSIGGRFFSSVGRIFRSPAGRDLGNVKNPRLSDRFSIVTSDGRLVKENGRAVVFEDKAGAEQWVSDRNKWKVQFFEKDPLTDRQRGRMQETEFDSLAERRRWMDTHAGPDGSVKVQRTIDPGTYYKIVEPYPSHEAMVNAGLIESISTNMREGFNAESVKLGKVKVLSELGKLATDQPTETHTVNLTSKGFTIDRALVERNPDIARLANGYVTPSMAQTLLATYGRSSPVMKALRLAEGFQRRMVTVLYPFRHVRQIFENETMLAFKDPGASMDVPGRARAFSEYLDWRRNGIETERIRRFQESGLHNTDIMTNEFQQVWNALSSVDALNDLSLTQRILLEAKTNPVLQQLIKADDFMAAAYQMEDQVYKLHLLNYLTDTRGLPLAEAIHETRRAFFDYEDVPPIIRMVNRFSPFSVNTTYQMARIFGTALRDHPTETITKIAAVSYGYHLLRQHLAKAAGVTEKDMDNMADLAPKNWEIILPITDEKGRNQTLNLGWLWAFGEIMNLKDTWETQPTDQSIFQTARRFVPMTAQPLAALANRDPYGRPITEKNKDSSAEAAHKILKTLARGYAPGMIGQYWDRAYSNAAKDEKSNPWQEALLETIIGRVEPLDVRQRVSTRMAIAGSNLRDINEYARADRAKVLRGDLQEKDANPLHSLLGLGKPSIQERAQIYEERMKEKDVTVPQMQHVVDAVERLQTKQGTRDEVKAAFKSLVDSGLYRNADEAFAALDQAMSTRETIKDIKTPGLARARDAGLKFAQAKVRGTVPPEVRDELKESLRKLPEGDQDAFMTWLETTIQDEREKLSKRKK